VSGVEMANFGRLMTAMVTPFTSDGAVDYAQAKHLANSLISSGTEGLIVTGTTGENPSLSHDENYKLWAEIKETVGESVPVIAGSGTNGTSETISLSKEAEKAGVDGLLIVVPYYNKPTQEGIFQHIKSVAESSPLPVLPYNVPSRTITNMTSETCLRVSEIPNVCGVKEASGDLTQIGEIIASAPADFKVWSGNDADTFHVISMGGYGVISVSAHFIGNQIQKMIQNILEGDLRVASAEHLNQLPISKQLFVIANPIPVKYCLNKIGFRVGDPRLPLTPPDDAISQLLDEMISRYEIDLPLN
tara:strand:- start:3669 stop:4577 length:909 start_codon:yes stop_codon:yes gene_type:complete